MKILKNSKITFSLIAISIAVYIITAILYGMEMTSYDAIEFMGFNPMIVYVEKSYYRLITANFIHFGIFHLVINCYSLYNIGPFVERVLGNKDYLIVIVSSMISTNLIPYILFFINGFGYNTVSGGISGVVCGLLGSLAAMALVLKGQFNDVFKSILPSIFMMLFLSVGFDDISLAGHLCGMFGGFVSSYIILKLRMNKKKQVIN